MSLRKHIANDVISRMTGQLRNAFDDPDFELDGIAKAAIHASVAREERKVQAEFAERENFATNGLPGLCEQLEALHDA